MITIDIVDKQCDRYGLVVADSILGRKYENNSEQISVIKPEGEIDSVCTMIVTHNGEIIDHINVGNDPINVTSNFSQYDTVKIGFSFSRANGYVKNTEVKAFYFLSAQKPEGFQASIPVYSGNVDRLIALAFADVSWKEGAHNTLVFKDVHGNALKEIDLHGFAQEQADLAEVDENKTSFVQNKKTSNLMNDGDGTSPFVTEEYMRNNSPQLLTEEDPTVPSYVKLLTELDVQKLHDIKVDGDGSKVLSNDGTYKELPTQENINNEIYEIVEDSIGRVYQVGFNATLSGNIITGELDETNSNIEFVNSSIYLINIHLALTTLTGDLNNSYQIVLKDKNGNTINLNCIFNRDATKTSTVGNLCALQNYHGDLGYTWEFQAIYRQISEGDVIYRSFYTDGISRETTATMTGQDLYIAVNNNALKVGTTVVASSNYSSNGTVFSAGHIYLITGEWVTGELILGYEDITPKTLGDLTLSQTGTMLKSTQTFTEHVHAMIEFDTDGVHYGADFVLHPYDTAICLVSYRFGTHDGTAYIDENGYINISIPDSLTFTNFKGHFIRL